MPFKSNTSIAPMPPVPRRRRPSRSMSCPYPRKLSRSPLKIPVERATNPGDFFEEGGAVITVQNSEFDSDGDRPYYTSEYCQGKGIPELGHTFDSRLQRLMTDAFQEHKEKVKRGFPETFKEWSSSFQGRASEWAYELEHDRFQDLKKFMEHAEPPANFPQYCMANGPEPHHTFDDVSSLNFVEYAREHKSPKGDVRLDASMWRNHLSESQKNGLMAIPGIKRIVLYEL